MILLTARTLDDFPAATPSSSVGGFGRKHLGKGGSSSVVTIGTGTEYVGAPLPEASGWTIRANIRIGMRIDRMSDQMCRGYNSVLYCIYGTSRL